MSFKAYAIKQMILLLSKFFFQNEVKKLMNKYHALYTLMNLEDHERIIWMFHDNLGAALPSA